MPVAAYLLCGKTLLSGRGDNCDPDVVVLRRYRPAPPPAWPMLAYAVLDPRPAPRSLSRLLVSARGVYVFQIVAAKIVEVRDNWDDLNVLQQ